MLDFLSTLFAAEVFGVPNRFVICLGIILILNLSLFILHKHKLNYLYEKEKCFEDTFKYSGTGMVLYNCDGSVYRANAALCSMLGYTEVEMKNQKLLDFTYEEDKEKHLGLKQELLSGSRESYELEKRYVNKKGNIVWVIKNVSLIKSKNGKPLYFISQVQDITKHKELQAELVGSSVKYRILLDSVDNSIAVFDNNFRYVVANKYLVQKINEFFNTDYNVETIVGKSLNEIYPGMCNTETFKIYQSVMRDKVPVVTNIEFKAGDGSSHLYEYHVIPALEGILVLSYEITDMVKSQKLISEKEMKYRSLVEHFLDGLILIDKDGYVVEFNNAMERITGISKDEALNKPVWELYFNMCPPHVKNEELFNKMRRQAEEKFILNNEQGTGKVNISKVFRKDGTSVDVEEYCYSIATENINMTCCIYRDITELKKLEHIKKSALESERLLKETIEFDKLRTEFFANLSHEFRTPLNIIMSSNKMIYDEAVRNGIVCKDYAFKYLNASKQNCFRLLRLMNNIIDITKIDSGYFKPNFQLYDIIKVIEDITLSVVDYAKSKEIEIIFDTDIEEKYLGCDADQVERIMLNLLSNAVKFTDHGGCIQVNVFDKDQGVEIIVKDNGVGIPQEQLPIIFDRFSQVDKSLTRSQEGSGIGLSIVKSLVEIHNGSIEALSSLGEGAAFMIYLPSNPITNPQSSCTQQFSSKVEKVSIEFSDIYF